MSADSQGQVAPKERHEKAAPKERDVKVADAVTGNWVDTIAPEATRPYLRLSRADRPIGTWLLLLPCWLGLTLAIASTGQATAYDAWLFIGCALGAFLMRGAGCTWNDITDRHLDGSVARTASRPIPSGQVTVKGAVAWMVIQALLALTILLTFNWAAIALGVASCAIVCIYPFAKRFTWWPQVFLGLAFNWGALLVWTAHTGSLTLAPVLLYLGGISWTLFYDTIYAHQDREDDAMIGIKSTARLFGENTKQWLRGFLMLTVCLVGASVIAAILPTQNTRALIIALAGVLAMGAHLSWQLLQLDIHDSDKCLRLFRSNRNAGLIPVLFFAVATLV